MSDSKKKEKKMRQTSFFGSKNETDWTINDVLLVGLMGHGSIKLGQAH